AGEVAHGAQADVQVQLLAQGHVQGTDAAANRGRERAFDGDHVILQYLQGLFRQPHVGAVDLGRFFAGIDFHPADLALAAVGFRDCRVHHFDHHRADVHARAVTLDVGNDRGIWYIQREIGVDGNLLTVSRYFNMLVHRVLRIGTSGSVFYKT